jgi:hypothetical protein
MGKLGGEDAEFFAGILKELKGGANSAKTAWNTTPTTACTEGEVLALVVNGRRWKPQLDDQVEVILPRPASTSKPAVRWMIPVT